MSSQPPQTEIELRAIHTTRLENYFNSISKSKVRARECIKLFETKRTERIALTQALYSQHDLVALAGIDLPSFSTDRLNLIDDAIALCNAHILLLEEAEHKFRQLWKTKKKGSVAVRDRIITEAQEEIDMMGQKLGKDFEQVTEEVRSHLPVCEEGDENNVHGTDEPHAPEQNDKDYDGDDEDAIRAHDGHD